MIFTLARKSLGARWGRNLFIAFAIAFGVSFVAGSFVLADSMRKTFDELFDDIVAGLDLQVRTKLAGTDVTEGAVRDPFPAELRDQVAAVPGVAIANGEFERFAQIIGADGDPLTTSGAPTMGIAWYEPLPGADDPFHIVEGAAPVGPGQVALDGDSAGKADYELGDTVPIILAGGVRDFELVGLVGRESTNSVGGATVSVFDAAEAGAILGAEGLYDSISIAVVDDSQVARVQAAIAEILPPNVEVVTGEQVADETKDAIGSIIDVFGTGLLIFALVTAFVSAFIINNIFGITIGQRLREMALLRAVGANVRQVRRLIVVEALAVAVIATVIGIFGGLVVASGLIAVFNAAGAGFPDIGLRMLPRTVIVSLIVGIGTVLLSVVLPARRAAKIPPVAAMRPEIGFAALARGRRLIGGAVVTAVGAVAFVVGLFVRPGGTQGLALFGGGGALLVFLGIASLSATVAHPVSLALGAPLASAFPVAGKMARQNAARSPRRTARTASALMIGVAIISAAAVFAYSLRDSFTAVLERSVQADYIVTASGGAALVPGGVSDALRDVPEIGAVSPVRGIAATLDLSDDGVFRSEEIDVLAVDPVGFPELVNLDVHDGGFDRLVTTGGGVLVHDERADDLGVAIGDIVDITYQNAVVGELEVVGLFGDSSLGSDFYVSLDHLADVSTQSAGDFFVLAGLADGATPEAGRAAIEATLDAFPQVDVQDNAEFRESISSQINQLLVIITALLAFAIALSFFGIAVTLAMAVFERTREIGLLRAVGMARRQLRRSIRLEAIIVAVFGVVVGAVVGLAMGIALTLAVPDNVIDQVTIPYPVLIVVLILTILAALVAATYPAYKASRMNVLEAIATE